MAAITSCVAVATPVMSLSVERTSLKQASVKTNTSSFGLRKQSVGRVVSTATPRDTSTILKEEIAKGIAEAIDTCANPESTAECAVAWDEVEELQAAAADVRRKEPKIVDPLEQYCEENPETDECRVYSD